MSLVGCTRLASQDRAQLGQHVILVQGTVPSGGSHSGTDHGLDFVYRVERVQGDRLWLYSVADFTEAIRLDPDSPVPYTDRAYGWNARREYARAIEDFTRAIELDPRLAYAHNGRAWIQATCPDASFRDAQRALASATRACELTDWKDANQIDTLAAAHAEAGDFDKAVTCEEKALKMFTEEPIRKRGRARLDRYRERKPYREDPGDM
jgi:tetratricopeptide (TPR) repeat protein